MSTAKYIAIDCGKYMTKASCMTAANTGVIKEVTFRTKMEETARSEAQGNSYVVVYNNRRYLVGEQAEISSNHSTKSELIHRICTYTALHRLANTGEELIVCVGCPLTIYENASSREEYKNYLFPSKQIDIKVGDTSKHLNIRNVIVLPETSGPIYLEPQSSNNTIAVIDVGGYNINACCYKPGGIPILSTLFTDVLGGAVLTQNLKNALMSKYNLDIPQWLMDEIIRNGYVISNTSPNGILEGSKEFISDFKKKHVQAIIQKCESNGYNLNLYKIQFIGGTSELLHDEIKDILPGATILPEANMANVRGFLKAITE